MTVRKVKMEPKKVVPIPSAKLTQKLEAPSNIFGKMIPIQPESVEHIVQNMIDPENIGMKSRIHDDLVMTALEMIGVWYEIEGYTDAKLVIDTFAQLFKVNSVSLDGQSREEIVKILAEAEKKMQADTRAITPPPE